MTPHEAPTPEKTKRAPHAHLILAVLFAVSILNFVDRQILGILAGRIKADLLITDAQLGFLYGTVFGIFYAVFGVPLGVYADLGSRRKLIGWGLALWSLMTALSGMATGFTSLALARVGVGVGEASASPAAYSLIADLFPRARRATALVHLCPRHLRRDRPQLVPRGGGGRRLECGLSPGPGALWSAGMAGGVPGRGSSGTAPRARGALISRAGTRGLGRP